MEPERLKLLVVWDSDLRVICHGHYEAATALNKKHYYLGIPIIILSSLAGTSVFASLSNEPSNYAKIIVGLISISVAVFGTLQTFMKFSERAEKHRESGARFGALLKEIEQYQTIDLNDGDFLKWSNSFKTRWDDLSLESPTIPPHIFRKYCNIHKSAHNNATQPSSVPPCSAESADG